MTTQYEIDQARRARAERLLLALIEAATDALSAIEDPDVRAQLQDALRPYNLVNLRRSVAYYNSIDEERRIEEERKEKSLRTFDELPDAPPRMQCHAYVARNMGRWTEFGRCEKPATRVVLDRETRRERVCCTIHAKQWALRGKPDVGWYDDRAHRASTATNESWYRIHGWCMVKVDDHLCTVRVDVGTGQHPGKEHR